MAGGDSAEDTNKKLEGLNLGAGIGLNSGTGSNSGSQLSAGAKMPWQRLDLAVHSVSSCDAHGMYHVCIHVFERMYVCVYIYIYIYIYI